jgi:hypothetical protein
VDRVQPDARRPHTQGAAVARSAATVIASGRSRYATRIQVAGEVAIDDEVREDGLVEHGRVLLGGRARRHKPVLKIGRDD